MELRFKPDFVQKIALAWAIASGSWAIAALPAAAHHPMGGRAPSTVFEGLLSGVAHPVIGLDHLAFVIGVGLLAALKPEKGWWVPVAFVLATLGGTGIHLLGVDLPFPEILISASVLAAGILLAVSTNLKLLGAIALGIVAGIFHGYAYGEAIVGAQMTPLIAYLAGFAIIQLAIALSAFKLGELALKSLNENTALSLRFAGFALCGAGAVFLSSAIFG
ncbi:MAG: HupE/UreJ family protein [Cyanobacteriota bacterium]|nr:HupE/UreJ family protein [Cyanobacteriota bacterium]